MQNKSEIQQGWDFAAQLMGSDISAEMAHEYVSMIEDAIKQFEDNINNHAYRSIGIKQLQGYMLEEWHAGTFNIDAAASDSSYSAEVPHSLAKDSADIVIKKNNQSIDAYSAKSYANAEKTAAEQARINPDTGRARYDGMGRLVPKDQLYDAKASAHKQAQRNKLIREHVSKANKETEEKLTDIIEMRDGTKSKAATKKELEQIARESKEKRFKAEDHDVTLDNAIKTKYLVKQVLKDGYKAAVISMAIQLAPEIYKAIDYLVKQGELDLKQIKHIGAKGISSGADGFVKGAVASAIYIFCKEGKLGKSLIGIDQTMIGVVTAIVLQTIKDSILVAAGRKTATEMGASFTNAVVVSGGYIAGAKIGGAIVQAINPELPVLGYVLGTLLGTAFCVTYSVSKKKLISICVDTGFTCFGLVEQDYEIPEQVLRELGIETIPIPRVAVSTVDVPVVAVDRVEIDCDVYETINFTQLKRGIIGVNKVGYVAN